MVPYEINTDKYSKDPAALTRMLHINKSVRTDWMIHGNVSMLYRTLLVSAVSTHNSDL